MIFSILLLVVIIFLSYRASPREKPEDAHVHGAGQIGLLAAVALFGVDYFTSFFYGTGEMMHALRPYGLQHWGYIAAAFIAFANLVFGALYMYSLGFINEGGGSYTASMRYLWPTLSLIVAVVLIQDYVFTIVVSALSGGDQLLSILNLYGKYWWLHFAIGAVLASTTYYLTIRGRGESSAHCVHPAGHLCHADGYHGCRIAHRSFQGGRSLTGCGRSAIGFDSAGALSPADCDHERYGCIERPGGHVEWYPVR